MKKMTIAANLSCNRQGEVKSCLTRDVLGFYHDDYHGGGRWKIDGTMENLICTLKNDRVKYSESVLQDSMKRLGDILKEDLPAVLRELRYSSIRVCVVPRSKSELHLKEDEKLFRQTVQNVVKQTFRLEDGTHDIIRHTNTRTTHSNKSGNGGDGDMPYVGITNDTCDISDAVIGKVVLLIDDLYTKSVNIDEDCIQALLDKGAKEVVFYSVGRTIRRGLI